jgi:AcrR family transcriptional regulator
VVARNEKLRSAQEVHTIAIVKLDGCPASGPAPGLRERKKSQTREAISNAAVKLAIERGPDNVRVADIAAEADVSPRTYNNYFASISEAICAGPADRALALADAVRARPAGEPLTEAIANAMAGLHDDDVTGNRELTKLIMCTPSLRGEFYKAIVGRDAGLAEVIAERTGTDPGDLYPQVLAAAVSGATRTAMLRWLADEDEDFGRLTREVLAMIAPMVTTHYAERKTVSPSNASHTRLQATG